jgi:hypothetical protein
MLIETFIEFYLLGSSTERGSNLLHELTGHVKVYFEEFTE